jgi:lipopolysaccharide export system protein LptC
MRTAEWVGNVVSIIFFIVLAVASWGLSEVLQRGRSNETGALATGPNAVIDGARILRSDALGRPHYRIEAARITHSDTDDRSVFIQPFMVSLAPNKPATTVKANSASATRNQNQIDLSGDVLITRPAFADQPAAKIATPRATLLIKEERATTDAPVFVQRGNATLQGVGMTFDQKTQRIDITSESRMVMPREKNR